MGDGTHCRLGLFLDEDCSGCAFVSRFANQILQVFRNLVHNHAGYELVFVVLENLGADFVAVAIPHAKIVIDCHFHAEFPFVSMFGTMRKGSRFFDFKFYSVKPQG